MSDEIERRGRNPTSRARLAEFIKAMPIPRHTASMQKQNASRCAFRHHVCDELRVFEWDSDHIPCINFPISSRFCSINSLLVASTIRRKSGSVFDGRTMNHQS